MTLCYDESRLLSLTSQLFLVAVFSLGSGNSVAKADEHPIVPGFERFHTEKPSAADGQLLLDELRCAACHANLPKAAHPRTAPNLQNIGNRVRPNAIQAIIANPHKSKPGALMPSMLSGLADAERDKVAEAITHFLVGRNRLADTPPAGVVRGEKRFHEVGCVACHQPQKDGAAQIDGSVPLTFVDKKYTVSSLTAFLKNPHAARPSGRMPNLNLNDDEARNIASYLLRDIKVAANLTYKYYEGNWQKLPDFDSLEPKSSGSTTGFDLKIRGRDNDFGLVFEGFLQISKAGEYDFELASDDGSRLMIDGENLITVDGIHPMQRQRAKKTLSAGPHAIRVEFFEAGGGEELEVRMQGPGQKKQDPASLITATREPIVDEDAYKFDPKLAEQGRTFFSRYGCVSCHDLRRDGKLVGKPLNGGNTASPGSRGCMADKPPFAGVPDYNLSDAQARALDLILNGPGSKAPRAPTIASTMTTFNCYACHSRDKIGGPERSRNDYFVTKIPEMGDEGRVPPALDGVGDKLNDSWLKHVMDNGANDRPYMLTRMPKFGKEHVGAIVEAFAKADRKEEVVKIAFTDPPHRVKSAGRLMVGGDGLSCVKCHYFGKYKATGIQAMDLQTMTRRLRRDWFHRYLLDPQAYRPGTRMPQAWPRGRSSMKTTLDGTAPTQIEAIWDYLALGPDAPLPSGMVSGRMEQKPIFEPIIYRNFITSLSPRGIAVGNPEKVHYAWDATEMSLALIWQGAFIDAAKHWTGRGQGTQEPLGDNRYSLVRGTPIAKLTYASKPWPKTTEGLQFRGYRLNKKLQPTFHYTIGKDAVSDFIEPKKDNPLSWFERTITISPAIAGTAKWYLRAATGSVKKLEDGSFLIDDLVEMKFPESKPLIREVGGGKQELIVPFTTKVVQQIRW